MAISPQKLASIEIVLAYPDYSSRLFKIFVKASQLHRWLAAPRRSTAPGVPPETPVLRSYLEPTQLFYCPLPIRVKGGDRCPTYDASRQTMSGLHSGQKIQRLTKLTLDTGDRQKNAELASGRKQRSVGAGYAAGSL
ncbi:MAG: hypothetical protein AAGA83_15155 [Cyanobacteria bacterium P01_F01_bin.116]